MTQIAYENGQKTLKFGHIELETFNKTSKK